MRVYGEQGRRAPDFDGDGRVDFAVTQIRAGPAVSQCWRTSGAASDARGAAPAIRAELGPWSAFVAVKPGGRRASSLRQRLLVARQPRASARHAEPPRRSSALARRADHGCSLKSDARNQDSSGWHAGEGGTVSKTASCWRFIRDEHGDGVVPGVPDRVRRRDAQGVGSADPF
jgi:hypothetical protein